MNLRSRREQTIFRRNRAQRAEPSPLVGDFQRDWQNAVAVKLDQSRNPFLQRIRCRWIAAALQDCAAPQFAHDQHTEKILIRWKRACPSADLWSTSFAFAQLRNDVRVEQKTIHNFTLRGLCFGLRKMRPLPTSGMVRM